MSTDLLTPKEAAALLRVSTDTLEAWRAKRKGPPWTKLGDGQRAHVRYTRAGIEEFLKARQQ
ncbi:MAG: helix-turn-helix transcriptional regulator [Bosea sp. (in: a-proteobacteria)]